MHTHTHSHSHPFTRWGICEKRNKQTDWVRIEIIIILIGGSASRLGVSPPPLSHWFTIYDIQFIPHTIYITISFHIFSTRVYWKLKIVQKLFWHWQISRRPIIVFQVSCVFLFPKLRDLLKFDFVILTNYKFVLNCLSCLFIFSYVFVLNKLKLRTYLRLNAAQAN